MMTESQLQAEYISYKLAYGAPTAFTPTYFGSTTAGATTYTLQVGRYVRIVNVVQCWGRVAWTAATGTGSGRIGGLPYAATSVENMIFPVTLWANGITWGGAGTVPSYRLDAGSGVMSLEVATSNAGIGAIAVEAAGDVAFHLSYFIDQ